MKSKLLILSIGCLLLWSMGCKKDNGNNPFKAVFSYSTGGFIVIFKNFTDFTNYSKPFATYHWDFGDGDTSSAINPSHTYSKGGDYVVTLTAKKSGTVSAFFDTVSIAGPHIVIDGDLSDWDHVDYAYKSQNGGTLVGVKDFAFGDSVFFYLEGTTNFTFGPFQMYFDTDGDTTTGFRFSDYPAGSGADMKYEGALNAWGELTKHIDQRDDDDWSDAVGDLDDGTLGISFSGMIDLDNGNKVVEFSIAKAKLGSGSKGTLGYAFLDLDSGWSPKGSVPNAGEDTSKFLKIDF